MTWLIDHRCAIVLSPIITKLWRLCFYRHVSVHKGWYASMHWGWPPGRDGYCYGRYASYWNAFLFSGCDWIIILWKVQNSDFPKDRLKFRFEQYTVIGNILVLHCAHGKNTRYYAEIGHISACSHIKRLGLLECNDNGFTAPSTTD